MAGEYGLSDRAWAAIEPLLPTNQPGARRVDDRRLISGIIHVLRPGYRWQDCPPVYGPATTIYNRFNRWSHKGHWKRDDRINDANRHQHNRRAKTWLCRIRL